MPRFVRVTARCSACDIVEQFSLVAPGNFDDRVFRIRRDDWPWCRDCEHDMDSCEKKGIVSDGPLLHFGGGHERQVGVCEVWPLVSGKAGRCGAGQAATHDDAMRASRSPRRTPPVSGPSGSDRDSGSLSRATRSTCIRFRRWDSLACRFSLHLLHLMPPALSYHCGHSIFNSHASRHLVGSV